MQIKTILTGKEITPDTREASDFVNKNKYTCFVKGSLAKDYFLNCTGSSHNVSSHPTPVWIPGVKMTDTGLGKEVKIRNFTGFKRHSQDSHFPTSQSEKSICLKHIKKTAERNSSSFKEQNIISAPLTNVFSSAIKCGNIN